MRLSFSEYVENYLQERRFIKSHYAYIVNMDHVLLLRRYSFYMNNGEIVPISKRVYNDVKKHYIDYIQNKAYE
jgi:DNA-binding LytR/AlgR family response regulator